MGFKIKFLGCFKYISFFALAFVLWLCSILYPNYLFTNKYNFKHIKVYYNGDLDTVKFNQVLKEANNKLIKSVLYNNKERKIYICNNKFIYSYLAFSNFRGLAVNYTYRNNIIIAWVDTEKSKSQSFFKDYSEDLDKLIAHEIVHSFVKENFPYRIDKWKNEGYSEYVAYDKKVDIKKDFSKYLQTKDIYIKYRIVFYYLIEYKKMTIEEIFKSDLGFEEVYQNIENKLSKQEIENNLN